MILYRNTKVKIRSPDGDTEYFDIVAGVLQGDTLAPYLFIICQDYVLRTSIDKIKENGFELTKKRSRRYPATTITDADYADDIAILANTIGQSWTSPGSNTPQDTNCTATYPLSRKLSKLDEPDMQVTAGEAEMNS